MKDNGMQKSLCVAAAQDFLRYCRIKDVNECQCQVVAAVVLVCCTVAIVLVLLDNCVGCAGAAGH